MRGIGVNLRVLRGKYWDSNFPLLLKLIFIHIFLALKEPDVNNPQRQLGVN
jgi:hypothetical protein